MKLAMAQMSMTGSMDENLKKSLAFCDAAAGSGHADAEHGLDMGGPQGQRRLLILPGHGAQRRLRHGDDRGQNHHRQHDDSRQERGAGGQVKGHPDGGHQQDHTHQAVHHGGDAGQQFHCRMNYGGKLRRRHLGQENGRHQADGHPHENGPRRAREGGEDDGEDAEVSGRGIPAGPEQEVDGPDLQNGRQARDDKVDADEEHERHSHHAADKEEGIHHPLHGLQGFFPGHGLLFPVGGADQRAVHGGLHSLPRDFMFHKVLLCSRTRRPSRFQRNGRRPSGGHGG